MTGESWAALKTVTLYFVTYCFIAFFHFSDITRKTTEVTLDIYNYERTESGKQVAVFLELL